MENKATGGSPYLWNPDPFGDDPLKGKWVEIAIAATHVAFHLTRQSKPPLTATERWELICRIIPEVRE